MSVDGITAHALDFIDGNLNCAWYRDEIMNQHLNSETCLL